MVSKKDCESEKIGKTEIVKETLEYLCLLDRPNFELLQTSPPVPLYLRSADPVRGKSQGRRRADVHLRGVLDGKGPGASSVTGAAMDGGGWRDACPSPGHGRTAANQVKTSTKMKKHQVIFPVLFHFLSFGLFFRSSSKPIFLLLLMFTSSRGKISSWKI